MKDRQAMVEILDSLLDADDPDPTTIVLCQGPPRCARVSSEDEEWEPCPWCYRVQTNDGRTAEAIVQDLEKCQ